MMSLTPAHDPNPVRTGEQCALSERKNVCDEPPQPHDPAQRQDRSKGLLKVNAAQDQEHLQHSEHQQRGDAHDRCEEAQRGRIRGQDTVERQSNRGEEQELEAADCVIDATEDAAFDEEDDESYKSDNSRCSS